MGGEVARPERDGRVGGGGEGGSDNAALAGHDDLVLVVGEDICGIAEGEFVEGLDELVHGHGEGDDFWIIYSTEKFLDLGEGGEDGEVFVHYPCGGVGCD